MDIIVVLLVENFFQRPIDQKYLLDPIFPTLVKVLPPRETCMFLSGVASYKIGLIQYLLTITARICLAYFLKF